MNIPCLLTQMHLNNLICDCGMSYIIRCDDGRFVIIDGGIGEYDEPLFLLEKLQEQNTLDRITVAAWFISHPHDDHFGCFDKFMEQYGDRIELQSLIFRFPKAGKAHGSSKTEPFYRMLVKLNGTAVITPDSGDRFTYGSCRFDILFTEADLTNPTGYYINDCSLAFMFTFGKYKTLFIADGCGEQAAVLCGKYSADELKCDLLQVGHHGYWGGSNELYTKADPRILLWPCPDYHLPVIASAETNVTLRSLPHLERIIYSGHEEVTLNLSEELQIPELSFPSVREWNDFSRITSLYWANMQGNDYGYGAVSVSGSEKSCVLTNNSDAHCALQMVQQWMVADAGEYTLTINGILQEGSLGFQYEGIAPHGLRNASPVWPAVQNGQQFSLQLHADAASNKAVLQCNGNETSLPFNPAEPHGFYLFLKGKLELTYVKLEKK